MIDGTNSRVEQELTGAGYSAPISRLERIIDGEDIKPLSRIEDKMKQYIAGGGGGIESACTVDAGPRRFMGPFIEELNGVAASEEVYSPYNWIEAWGKRNNIYPNVDTNGKWHVHSINNGNAQCSNGGIYIMGIDPKKVESVYFHILVDGNKSYYPSENRDSYKTVMALTSRICMYENDFWNNQYTVDCARLDRCQQDSQGNWHFKTVLHGTLHVDWAIHDISKYPVLWLCYNSYGLDMTFEEIRFNLREV